MLFFCIIIMKTQRNTSFGIAAYLLLSGFTTLHSQDKSNVKLGLRISPNFSWVNVQRGPMSNASLGVGFSYGVTGDFSLGRNNNYFLATEVSISTIPAIIQNTGILKRIVLSTTIPGEKDTFTYKPHEVNFNYTVQYFQLPISIKMKSAPMGKIRYFVQFGLAPSFKIRGNLKTNISGSQSIYPLGTKNHDPNIKTDDTYQFNGLDVSGSQKTETINSYIDDIKATRMPMILGAGFEYTLSESTSFVCGLRFDNAINNFFKDPNITGRSNMISLQAGIVF